MKKLLALLFLSVLIDFTGLAQTFNGRLLDAQTGQPIGFGSIGILHRDAGTVSDENGYFRLQTQQAGPTDTVRISFLGYASRTFTVNQLTQLSRTEAGVIKLTPKNQQLREVVIKPKYTAWLVSGNTTKTKSMILGFTSNDLGSEIGTVLKYRKKKPGRLHKVHFNIATNRFDTLLFRVNLYRFEKGKVGESLLQKPVFVKTTMEDGTLSVDLSEHQLYLTGDSFLSLEWIKDLKGSGLMFSAGFFNSDSYARKTSQANWHGLPAGLGFWADIEYEK